MFNLFDSVLSATASIILPNKGIKGGKLIPRLQLRADKTTKLMLAEFLCPTHLGLTQKESSWCLASLGRSTGCAALS